jgi:hypothetical protein
VAAQKVLAAKLEGRDLAAERREARRRVVADRVEDLLETFIAQHVSQTRSAVDVSRLLRREVGRPWAGRSIHQIIKRDVVEVISAIEQRGAPGSANKTLKSLKTFLRWCVGRAVLDRSPAEGIPLPRRRLREIEFSMTRNSRKSSSRLGRSAVRMATSLNFWPSPGSAGKRSHK